jgi:DNA-directed RNA polymerase sigma subunit (sigma70/sigma32)
LSTKEKAVVIGFFGLEGEKMTLQQLSKQLKCSKEYVRQIREKALGKLRSSIGLEKIANI